MPSVLALGSGSPKLHDTWHPFLHPEKPDSIERSGQRAVQKEDARRIVMVYDDSERKITRKGVLDE